MPGMSIGIGGGAGFGPIRSIASPSYGSAESYGAGVASGAFGDGLTTPSSGKGMSAHHATGLFFWIGVGSIAAMIWIRSTLPN